MSLSLAAVGDLSFAGPYADEPAPRLLAEPAACLREADVAIGNLESPLMTSGRAIGRKCTLRACPQWADTLRDAGVSLVSLANNHIMDYGPTGLVETMEALDLAGVRFVGAGLDRERACAPVFLTVRGFRVACLARTSVVVTAPTYAKEAAPGAAWLDVTETIAAIARCRRQADVLILLLHWGLEHYRYPSPAQRALARQLVRAGADVILGHHPHVTQGIERLGLAVVAYSLGNFAFSEFEWDWAGADGNSRREHLRLSAENRQGLILGLRYVLDQAPAVEMRPTVIETDGQVRLDGEQQHLRGLHSLAAMLSRPGYRWWWWLYALSREWALRLRPQGLSGSHVVRMLFRIRPRHVRHLAESLYRSGRIVLEKSTNPYE
jgi:poly-gamma-glutamate synthesis protein (capsule biosynthesis protein)